MAPLPLPSALCWEPLASTPKLPRYIHGPGVLCLCTLLLPVDATPPTRPPTHPPTHPPMPADDPLVGSIAQQLLTDKEGHDKQAAEWTKRFAQG